MIAARAAAVILAAAFGAMSTATEAQSTVYDANCAICHQAAGAGVPGSFPRLAGRAGALAALPDGRRVMISTVLYGMTGRLQVEGQTIVGLMPSFAALSDVEISEALNYVAHLEGKPPPRFTAAEIATLRAQPPLTPAQVNALARDPALAKAAP